MGESLAVVWIAKSYTKKLSIKPVNSFEDWTEL